MTGLELRFIRKALKLTQADLAKQLNVHPITICNYERGYWDVPKWMDLLDWSKLETPKPTEV